jgi:hypothetical protein
MAANAVSTAVHLSVIDLVLMGDLSNSLGVFTVFVMVG